MNTSIYNHLLTTYTPRPLTKHDTHKASELRSIIGKIGKITQSSPIYLVKLSDARQSYALGIKESAIMMQNSLNELSDTSADGVFSKLKAYSSSPEEVEATIIGGDYEKLPEGFSIKVDELARTQVNHTKEVYPTGKPLTGGIYKFQVSVGDDIYDFQYNVKNDSNNKEILEGLSSFINKAKIGLRTDVLRSDSDGLINLRIESEMTGASGDEPIFTFSDKSIVGERGIIGYYEFNNVSRRPKSATFYMDGIKKHTLSNEFTLGKSLNVKLHDITDDAVSIRYYPDNEQVINNVEKIASAYNYMIDSTAEYSKAASGTLKLANEIRYAVEPHKSELESCGLVIGEDGRMSVDHSLVIQAVNDGDMQKLFSSDSAFMQRLGKKADEVKLNPMDYVDKTLVSYPNYNKAAQGYSYITSLYSGMIFNFYC